MSSIIPNVPERCEIAGCIYDTEHPELLGRDMLEVYCPTTDTLVCVGWHPEEDTNGQYVVVAYRQCERITEPFRTRSIARAIEETQRLAKMFQELFAVVANGNESLDSPHEP